MNLSKQMTPNKLTYTIQEISKAWFKFTQPKYLVDNKAIELKPGGMIEYSEPANIRRLEPDYSQWIAYLLSEEWRNDTK